MPTIRVCACLLAIAVAAGADKGHERFSENDEMERPHETAKVWEAQAEQVPEADEGPRLTGGYMWRGRLDRSARPFHQWELRVAAGTGDLAGVRLRVIALDAMLEPIHGKKGHWVKLGNLDAGDEVDLSYKLNTSHPEAYRVEVTWRGGERSFVNSEPGALPAVEHPGEDQPRLLVVMPDFGYDKHRKMAMVTFILRNIGEGEATGVEHTIHFLDNDRKVVHTATYVPEEGTIAGGYHDKQKVIVKKCPPFKQIQVRTRTAAAGAGGFQLDPGRFTDAKDLEVAELAIADGTLSARLRNGLDEDIAALHVTVDLLDADGAVIESARVKLEDVASGSKVPFEAEVGDVEGVAGWGIGFAFDDGPLTAGGGGSGGGDGTGASQDLDGIVVTILDQRVDDDGLHLDVRVANRRDASMDGLICTFQLDAGGEQTSVDLDVGDLPAGEGFEGSLVAKGLTGLEGLGISWRTGG